LIRTDAPDRDTIVDRAQRLALRDQSLGHAFQIEPAGEQGGPAVLDLALRSRPCFDRRMLRRASDSASAI
jgi:hypothetical protein